MSASKDEHGATWPLSRGDAATTPAEADSASSHSSLPIYNAFADADAVVAGAILKQEAALLVRSSIPVIAAYILQYSFGFISLLVVGHIGPNELAAAALGNMALVVIVLSPGIGIAAVLDTLCSTSFTASSDKTLVGFHLQRGLIAIVCHIIAIAPVMWYLDSALVWLKQDVAISALCGQYLRIQMLGALPWLAFECVKRFLQAQGHMKAGTLVLLAVLPVHLANNYLLVWSPSYGWGFLGAPIACAATNWLILIGITIYACCSSARNAWGGWSAQALWAMSQYFRLAVPSMIMICAEWWILDLLALAASYLGNTTLAAQSIVINICSITYQIPDGMSIAVCNRVGNLIGQARHRRAQLATWLGLAAAAVVGTATLCVTLVFKDLWGRIYSDDVRIIACVALIMQACAVFQLFDALNSVGSGILRALGRQTAGAWINFPTYYAIGFPLGLFLTYGSPKMGVIGLWVGICAGVILAVALQIYICVKTSWVDEVRRCMLRVSLDENALSTRHKPSSHTDEYTDHTCNDSASASTTRHTSIGALAYN